MKPFPGLKVFLHDGGFIERAEAIAARYIVRPSKGRGDGVFARQDLEPGATIMIDRKTCHIRKSNTAIDDRDVLEAFRQLDPIDQKLFMALHESHRPLKTKIFRIYKGNCFGDRRGSYLLLRVSKLNHSCLPNAAVQNWKAEDERVVAIRPIKAGQEIFISYNGEFDGCTKIQRRAATKTYFGFECDCPACTRNPSEQYLSDCRRTLISALNARLRGHKAPDYRKMESLLTMSAGEVESSEVRKGWKRVPLQQQLTIQEKTAYNFLEASLRDAEGLLGLSSSASNYLLAYAYLLQQADQDEVILRPTLELAQIWRERTMELMTVIHAPESEVYVQTKDTLSTYWRMSGMEQSSFVFNSPLGLDAFAVQVGVFQGQANAKRFEIFEEGEYFDKVRKGLLPVAMSPERSRGNGRRPAAAFSVDAMAGRNLPGRF